MHDGFCLLCAECIHVKRDVNRKENLEETAEESRAAQQREGACKGE